MRRIEAQRFGKTKTPRRSLDGTDTSAGSRYIPAAVKRIVVERDRDQCTFVNAAGRRCSSRGSLEFHHDEPYALGGDRSPENIRLLCRAHNGYLAELTYGKDVVGQYRHAGVVVSADSGAPQSELPRLINSVRTELSYRVAAVNPRCLRSSELTSAQQELILRKKAVCCRMVKAIERASDVDCMS